VGYPNRHHLGRETFLAPVTWDGEGWPLVNGGERLALDMAGPTLPLQPWPEDPPRDVFDRLRPCWNYLRNPRPGDYALVPGGGLRLHGSALTLDQEDSPAWLGRRQMHHHGVFRCRIASTPDQAGDESGITAFMNASHHYELALVRRDGSRRAIVRRRIGSLQAIVADEPCPEGPVELAIHAEPERYRFALDGRMLADGETRYLATEVAGGFTGVYLAMYATGNGRRASGATVIDWCEYLPGAAP
jgi:alpha-N-arabinofuranosidase